MKQYIAILNFVITIIAIITIIVSMKKIVTKSTFTIRFIIVLILQFYTISRQLGGLLLCRVMNSYRQRLLPENLEAQLFLTENRSFWDRESAKNGLRREKMNTFVTFFPVINAF